MSRKAAGGSGSGRSVEEAGKPARLWSPEERLEAFEAVLDAMAEGETLEQGVKGLQARLGRSCTAGTLRRWIADDEAWAARYHRARRVLAQALADEAIQIARDSTSYSTATDRVLIDTLKWAAAKANPAEYGERQTVEHQGAQTLQVRVVEESPAVRNPEAMQGQMQGQMRDQIRDQMRDQVGNAIASAMTSAITQPVVLTLPVLTNTTSSAMLQNLENP